MSALSRLNPRERMLLFVVLPVALILALIWFVWLPLNEHRRSLGAEIANYRLVEASARAAAARPATQRPELSQDRAPLAARVTRSAEAAGLLLRRLEPDGGLLRVTIDEAAFDAVILWISDLETDEAVGVVAIEAERRTEPGVVSLRLTLEEMG
ncbi:type II secretion system protein GspM [uncultured Limimaricola sp.]|uniref:type II secretion system protein GspM n=1 Tax=uncultured Limimaricola sp. TaxID=2211667 RepID=UPI0030F507F7